MIKDHSAIGLKHQTEKEDVGLVNFNFVWALVGFLAAIIWCHHQRKSHTEKMQAS